VIADHSKSDERCCDAVIIRESSYVNGAFAANGLPANGGVSFSGPGTVDDRQSANDSEFRDKIRQTGFSAQLDWDLGEAADFVWIAGWRKSRAESRQESDFTAADVFSTSNNTSVTGPNSPESFTEITTITHEVRLTGTLGERIDYLVGAYYADEEIREIQSLTLGPDHQAYISAALTSVGVPGPNPARNIFAGGVSSAGNFAANHFKQNGRNFSLFTNNTIHFTDRLSLNFGARYSNDRKRGIFDQLAANSPACAAVIARAPLLPATLAPLVPLARALTCFPFSTAVGQGPQEFDRVFKDKNFIYTVKLLGEVTEDINAYASFSHGYKAGGFNLDPTAAVGGADPRFDSEKVDAYELGIKAQLFDRRLTANFAAFHQELTDFQVLEFTGVQFVTFNVPKAKSTGFELELLARVTEELRLNGSVTYADARYPRDCGGPTPPASVALLCGNDLTNAPPWVLVGGVSYDRDLGNGLEIGFNANVRWEDDRRTSTQALTTVAAGTGTLGPTLNLIRSPNDIQESNAKVNLRFAIGSVDDRWRVEVWGNNIFDEQTYHVVANTPLRGVSSLPGPLNAGGISLSRIAFLQEPRTYGVTLRTQF
jgi:iron complex outermembrane recepter protein